MARIRLSTTVDSTLLENARSLRSGLTDAALVDEALAALLARHRAAELDASYAAYERHAGSRRAVILDPAEDPVPQQSAVNLDLVESVSLGVLVERRGRLADARMREICAALAVAVDCES